MLVAQGFSEWEAAEVVIVIVVIVIIAIGIIAIGIIAIATGA